MKRTVKHNFKNAFKHCVSFQDKEKKKGTDFHLQGHPPLVMMFVTNHAKLRSKGQKCQYPSSSYKTHKPQTHSSPPEGQRVDEFR